MIVHTEIANETANTQLITTIPIGVDRRSSETALFDSFCLLFGSV